MFFFEHTSLRLYVLSSINDQLVQLNNRLLWIVLFVKLKRLDLMLAMCDFEDDIATSDVKTRVSMHFYRFSWTIENFSKLCEETSLESPKFHPTPDYEFSAKLEITSDECCLWFKLNAGNESALRVRHVSVIEKNGDLLYEQSETKTYSEKAPDMKILLYYHKQTLRPPSLSEEDSVSFSCSMEIYGSVDSKIYEPRNKESKPFANLVQLSNDLKDMYHDSHNTDMCLKVGDNEIRTHRAILSARSPVFARLFKADMAETERNVINIEDCEFPVLQDLVGYLYTGVLDVYDFDRLCSLVYAADKYDVGSLHKTCVDLLLSKMEEDNACQLLVLAERHSMVDFKNSVMSFIKFYIKDILDTDGWISLTKNSPSLAGEVVNL